MVATYNFGSVYIHAIVILQNYHTHVYKASIFISTAVLFD